MRRVVQVSDRFNPSRHLSGHDFAEPASALVIVGAVLIPDLTATLASAVLSSLNEAGVPIGSNDAVVQSGAVHVLHSVLSVVSVHVLDEAEAARRLRVAVQTNDHSLYSTAFAEQLVDLFLAGVE